MTNEIITMGAINQDIFLNANSFPNHGDTVWLKSINKQTGGKGANQALTLSRLNNDIRFIGAVGDDDHGQNMLKYFKNLHLNTDYIQVKQEVETGTFFIILDSTGENTMLGTLGANNLLNEKDVEYAFENTEANYFLLQLETSKDSILSALKLAKSKGITVVLDPAPSDGFNIQYLKYADIITPNQQEAETITKIKVTDKDTAFEAAKAIHKMGVATVIVKIGAQGSVIYNNNIEAFIPAYHVKAINTVGAGDVFAGALTSELNNGKSLKESVKFATIASAIKIRSSKTQEAIPTQDEIEKFIEKHS